MRSFWNYRIAVIGLVTTIGFLASCGGSTNNDQGVSFSLLGFRDACEESSGAVQPNITGLVRPLDPTGTVEPSAVDGDNFTSGAVIAGLVLENRLAVQFVRTQRAFMTYYIPGASVQPPSTSEVATLFLAETGDTVSSTSTSTSTSTSSSGDSGSTTEGSSFGCASTFIVPAEIRQWLVLNQNSLPALPFTMEVTVYVTGLTSAGDRLDTNESSMLVQFTPDIRIPPDPSAEDGSTDSSTTGSSTDGSSTGTGTDSGTGTSGDTSDTSGDSSGNTDTSGDTGSSGDL